MIDLRKPLEGVPGLLLMAALIFFGATIGIGVALVFTWIPMSDALANFLGGVVGAGLGAALAVMGAVYVQRKERQDSLVGPATELIFNFGALQRDTFTLTVVLENMPLDGVERGLAHARIARVVPALRERYRTLTFPFALGQSICAQAERVKMRGLTAMEGIGEDVRGSAVAADKYERAGSAARLVVREVDNLLARVGREFQVPITTLGDELIVPRSRDTKSRREEPLSPSR